jgi:catechol 2,3-dioxygenase-like lactoylglutathione lyase family enzyme
LNASIQHAGISVADLDRSVAWYVQQFGFEEARRFEKESLEICGALLMLGDQGLEILQPYTPLPRREAGKTLPEQLSVTGANHLALAVDDVAACFAAMTEAGACMVTDLMDGRFFFCKDPDETLLEIRQA